MNVTGAMRCVSAREYRLFTIMTKVLQTAAHVMFWGAIAITVVGLALQYSDEIVRDN
jgi:type IV secretory pathway VirB3-like protein